jgi:trimeric autotransporter adhesin
MIPSNASRFLQSAFLGLLIAGSLSTLAQQPGTNASAVVPTLVQFSGTLTGSNGKPLTEITGVTFLLFANQNGGAPLWIETQNVQPDAGGQYTVMLGSTTSQGLPMNLFSSGQARWLAV